MYIYVIVCEGWHEDTTNHKHSYSRGHNLGPLRPIHTRGFAPGACSSLILHVSVHTRERFQVRSISVAPGACFQIFNRLNIEEHFAGWKFCSRGCSIPMKSSVHTEELCSPRSIRMITSAEALEHLF